MTRCSVNGNKSFRYVCGTFRSCSAVDTVLLGAVVKSDGSPSLPICPGPNPRDFRAEGDGVGRRVR